MHINLPRSTDQFIVLALIILGLLLAVPVGLATASSSSDVQLLILASFFMVICAFVSRGLFLLVAALTLGLNSTYLFSGDATLLTARWVVLGIGSVIGGMQFISRRRTHTLTLADKVVIIFLIFAFGSSVYSINPSITLQRSLSLALMYGTVFWMAWDYADKRGDEKVLGIVLGYTALLCCIGLIMIPFTEDVWLTNGRFQGIMINPNSIGLLAVLCAPLVLWRWLVARNPFNLLLMAAVMLSVILAASRNGLLAALVGMAYLMLRGKSKLLLAGIVAVAVSFVVLFPSPSDLDSYHRTTGISRLVDIGNIGDGSGRFTFWTESWPIIRERLWLGHGFGTEQEGIQTLSDIRAQDRLGAFHNSYLGITFNLGVVGLLLFFGPLIYLLIKSIQTTESTGKITYVHALQAVLLASLVSAFFETWPYSAGNAFSFPFWLCVMLLVRQFRQVKQAKPSDQLAGQT